MVGMPNVADARGPGWCAGSARQPTRWPWSAARPRPPGPGEARVAIGAVGLNFPDLLLCAGRYQERPELPFSPGFEAAGVVTETGPGAGLSPGEHVLVIPELPNGALQESITVSVRRAVSGAGRDAGGCGRRPAHRLPDRARWPAPPRRAPGRGDAADHGRAGGVGSAALQLGHAAGAVVIAAATGPRKADACRRMGADLVIDLASEPDPAGWVRAATGGHSADVIVDVVGGATFDWARRCVAWEGRIVVAGFTGGIGELRTNHVLLRNYSVVGLHLARYRRENSALLREVHDALVELWSGGAISPEIYRELPFDQAPAGLSLLSEREVIGRVLLRTATA